MILNILDAVVDILLAYSIRTWVGMKYAFFHYLDGCDVPVKWLKCS